MHAWGLARLDRDRALEFFAQAVPRDAGRHPGRNGTRRAFTSAAMAGSVDLVQRCFTGLEIRANRLILRPCWPEPLGPLTFRVNYRGNWLEITVRGRRARVQADPANSFPVEIGCHDVVHYLSPGGSIEVG